MLHVPSARVPSVHVSPEVLPVMVQVTLVDPDLVAVTVTVPLASAAVTVMSGVLSFVMLSVEDDPESEAATRSGALGTPGADESPATLITVESTFVGGPKFPARSVRALAESRMLKSPSDEQIAVTVTTLAGVELGVNEHVAALGLATLMKSLDDKPVTGSERFKVKT